MFWHFLTGIYAHENPQATRAPDSASMGPHTAHPTNSQGSPAESKQQEEGCHTHVRCRRPGPHFPRRSFTLPARASLNDVLASLQRLQFTFDEVSLKLAWLNACRQHAELKVRYPKFAVTVLLTLFLFKCVESGFSPCSPSVGHDGPGAEGWLV